MRHRTRKASPIGDMQRTMWRCSWTCQKRVSCRRDTAEHSTGQHSTAQRAAQHSTARGTARKSSVPVVFHNQTKLRIHQGEASSVRSDRDCEQKRVHPQTLRSFARVCTAAVCCLALALPTVPPARCSRTGPTPPRCCCCCCCWSPRSPLCVHTDDGRGGAGIRKEAAGHGKRPSTDAPAPPPCREDTQPGGDSKRRPPPRAGRGPRAANVRHGGRADVL